jgi:hypothetical protein
MAQSQSDWGMKASTHRVTQAGSETAEIVDAAEAERDRGLESERATRVHLGAQADHLLARCNIPGSFALPVIITHKSSRH